MSRGRATERVTKVGARPSGSDMRLWIIGLLLATVLGDVHADPWRLPSPGDVVSRAVVETSLTRHRVMQPVSFAPDLVVGLRDRLALAWHHSRMFDGRLGAGNGVCIAGPRETLGTTPAECRSEYTGAGLSVLYGLTSHATARTGIKLVDMHPVKVALTAGVILRAGVHRWWLVLAPSLSSGVTNRDAGNRDRIQAPVYAGRNIGRGEAHIRSGFDATLHTAGETFSVPVGAGGSFTIHDSWRIGAELTLDRALGMLNAMSWRSASVYIELDRAVRP